MCPARGRGGQHQRSVVTQTGGKPREQGPWTSAFMGVGVEHPSKGQEGISLVRLNAASHGQGRAKRGTFGRDHTSHTGARGSQPVCGAVGAAGK